MTMVPAVVQLVVFVATSEQLGMRPRCDPTIRTAPTNVYGRVSSAWVFLAVGTRNLGTMGSEVVMGIEIHHGVRIVAWGLKHIKFGHGVRNASWG